MAVLLIIGDGWMNKFRMGAKVWILNSKKTDGRYNQGKIVGVEANNDNLYFVSNADFFAGFNSFRYKVAFIDCFTGKGRFEWLTGEDLSKAKPEDATN